MSSLSSPTCIQSFCRSIVTLTVDYLRGYIETSLLHPQLAQSVQNLTENLSYNNNQHLDLKCIVSRWVERIKELFQRRNISLPVDHSQYVPPEQYSQRAEELDTAVDSLPDNVFIEKRNVYNSSQPLLHYKPRPYLTATAEEAMEQCRSSGGQWYTDAALAMQKLEAHCNSSAFLQQGWLEGGREIVAEFRRRIEAGGLGETFPTDGGWGEPERKWAAYWDRLRLTQGQALNDAVLSKEFRMILGRKSKATDNMITNIAGSIQPLQPVPSVLLCSVRGLFGMFPWRPPPCMNPSTGRPAVRLADSVAFDSSYYKLTRLSAETLLSLSMDADEIDTTAMEFKEFRRQLADVAIHPISDNTQEVVNKISNAHMLSTVRKYRSGVLSLAVAQLRGQVCVSRLPDLLARCEEELPVQEAQGQAALKPAVRRWVQRVKEIFLQQQGGSGQQHVSPEQFTLRAAELDAAVDEYLQVSSRRGAIGEQSIYSSTEI